MFQNIFSHSPPFIVKPKSETFDTLAKCQVFDVPSGCAGNVNTSRPSLPKHGKINILTFVVILRVLPDFWREID